jgi:hypothetical protein
MLYHAVINETERPVQDENHHVIIKPVDLILGCLLPFSQNCLSSRLQTENLDIESEHHLPAAL